MNYLDADKKDSHVSIRVFIFLNLYKFKKLLRILKNTQDMNLTHSCLISISQDVSGKMTGNRSHLYYCTLYFILKNVLTKNQYSYVIIINFCKN